MEVTPLRELCKTCKDKFICLTNQNKCGVVMETRKEKKKKVNTRLAGLIVALSDEVKVLLSSGLNEKAIIVLLHDSTKISKKIIEKVLNSIKNLKSVYCEQVNSS